MCLCLCLCEREQSVWVGGWVGENGGNQADRGSNGVEGTDRITVTRSLADITYTVAGRDPPPARRGGSDTRATLAAAAMRVAPAERRQSSARNRTPSPKTTWECWLPRCKAWARIGSQFRGAQTGGSKLLLACLSVW